jgi:hypothetical protein
MDTTYSGAFPTMRLTCAVAMAAMIVSSVFIWRSARLESSTLIDFVALGITMGGIAAGGAAWAVGAVKHRLRTPAAYLLGAIASVGVVVALSAAPLSAWAYLDPHGAYARNFGGAGACLAGTTYATDQARLSSGSGNRMEVTPQGTEDSPLVFTDTKGELKPADNHTRDVISQYAC